MTAPLKVAITGAAGNIGYSLLWRVASGDCFGKDQPIILSLLEITPAMDKLQGVIMELQDSAFPLVTAIEGTDDAHAAFKDADAVFLVGSRPRGPGMDRADLISANGKIFVGQGKALNGAKPTCRIITVGNPCNTNCLVAAHHAPDIPNRQFTAMTRLDQNRAIGQLAHAKGAAPSDVADVFIWGNHADTMYPDVRFGTLKGAPLTEQFDDAWLKGEFLTTVATRGKAIIQARGASSAASAASAAVDHMRDWFQGSNGQIVSMALVSEGWYGVPEGLVYSFPVRCEGGNYTVVEGLDIDAYAKGKIDENVKALQGEKDAVADLLT